MRIVSKHERNIVILCAIIISMALGICIFGRMYYFAKEAGYKEACQDFYSGKLKYEPTFSTDGTIKEWIKP